jgi:putative tricarboxylic transport membrane protein
MKIVEGMRRRWGLLILLVFVGTFLGASVALGIEKPKNYPERSVEAVVGYGAGGGSDLFARAVAAEARKIMKGSLVVVNKPGAGGVVGMEYIQGQPADGYTIWAGSSTVIVTAGLQGTTKHQYTDFEPIIRAQLDTMMLMVSAGGRFKNIQDVVADAKARPGQQSWGVVGLASGYTAYIADAFVRAVGITPKIVPFDQAGRQHAALLGGHIDVMMEEPGATVSLVEGKKVVPVVIFAENRVKPFPNLPTTFELGAKEALGIYRGVVVKKGTPPEIVRYLEEVFTQAVNTPAYKKYEQESFLDWRKGYMNSKDFAAFLKMDAERSAEFFKRTGVYQIKK